MSLKRAERKSCILSHQSKVFANIHSWCSPQVNMNYQEFNPSRGTTSTDTVVISSVLPKPFVESMRILFDIMVEDKSTGTVKFADIERRWCNDGLPHGILECLRNVTTSGGLLTFDRFCAGLKVCLLKNESEKVPSQFNSNFLMSKATTLSLPQMNNQFEFMERNPPPKPPRLAAAQTANLGVANPKRREPRRHTLQNGIDYNRLKRLKQLEQEKNYLNEGLRSIQQTQRWFSKQIENVQEQIRQIGRLGIPIGNSNYHQEQLELKRAQISEIGRYLNRLVENWEHVDKDNIPYELNLEITQRHSHDKTTALIEELNRKQQIISVLENEKMILLKRFGW